MKYSVLALGVIAFSLKGMDTLPFKEKENKDEIIEMGSGKDLNNYKKSNAIDIELEDMQYNNDIQDNHHQFTQNVLFSLPIFRGKKEEEINQYMSYIANVKPTEYGKIIESLSHKHGTFKKRGIRTIDPQDVTDINAKIQYALLEVSLENQKAAVENRKEDLAQGEKDRKRSLILSITSMVLSVPGLTLAILGVIKAFA